MDRDEFQHLLTPLLLAMLTEFDLPTWTAYYLALQDVSVPVLQLAIEAIRREPRSFFLKAGEIRAICEKQRRQVVAANPWEPCCECEDTPRWRTIVIDGITRVDKCPCLERYRERLAGMGVLEPLAMLPSEVGAGDVVEHPTLEQLPADVRRRLQSVANQKTLR